MKIKGTGLLLLLGLFLMSATPMPPDEFDIIGSFIRTGDAHGIALHFDRNVDIKTEDKSITYSKNQAELVLREFFQHVHPKGFNIIHRGSSAKGARYIIGTLETNQGNYRCFVYVKELNGKMLIEEMSFERQ